MKETLAYIKNFVRDRHIGSITPTSQYAVEQICKKIDFPSTQTVIEYGPGRGVFTRYLLQKLPAHARVIAIEANQDFFLSLQAKLQDPRLTLIHGRAENVRDILAPLGIHQVDVVISGIPFSFFDQHLKDMIISNTKAVLKKDGQFIIYQFVVPSPDNHRILLHSLKSQLPLVRKSVELLNIPPLRVYEATNI